MALICPCGCGAKVSWWLRPSVKIYPEVAELADVLRREIVPFWTANAEALEHEDSRREKAVRARDGLSELAWDGDGFARDLVDAFHGDRRVDLQPGRLRAWLKAARGVVAGSERLAAEILEATELAGREPE